MTFLFFLTTLASSVYSANASEADDFPRSKPDFGGIDEKGWVEIGELTAKGEVLVFAALDWPLRPCQSLVHVLLDSPVLCSP